jgi:hypothetical protein
MGGEDVTSESGAKNKVIFPLGRGRKGIKQLEKCMKQYLYESHLQYLDSAGLQNEICKIFTKNNFTVIGTQRPQGQFYLSQGN